MRDNSLRQSIQSAHDDFAKISEEISVAEQTQQRTEQARQDEAKRQSALAAQQQASAEANAWAPIEPKATANVHLEYDKFKNITDISVGGPRDGWGVPFQIGKPTGNYRLSLTNDNTPMFYARMNSAFTGAVINMRPQDIGLHIMTNGSDIFNTVNVGDSIYFIIDNQRIEVKAVGADPSEVVVLLTPANALAMSNASDLECMIDDMYAFKFTPFQQTGFKELLKTIGLAPSK